MVEFNAIDGNEPVYGKKSGEQKTNSTQGDGGTVWDTELGNVDIYPTLFDVSDDAVISAFNDYKGTRYKPTTTDPDGRKYHITETNAKFKGDNVFSASKDVTKGNYVIRNNDGVTIYQKDGERYAIGNNGKGKLYKDMDGNGEIRANEEVTDEEEIKKIKAEAFMGSDNYHPSRQENLNYEIFHQDISPAGIQNKELQELYKKIDNPDVALTYGQTSHGKTSDKLEVAFSNNMGYKRLDEEGKNIAIRDTDGTTYVEKEGQLYKVTTDGKYYKKIGDNQYEEITDKKVTKQLKDDAHIATKDQVNMVHSTAATIGRNY